MDGVLVAEGGAVANESDDGVCVAGRDVEGGSILVGARTTFWSLGDRDVALGLARVVGESSLTEIEVEAVVLFFGGGVQS